MYAKHSKIYALYELLHPPSHLSFLSSPSPLLDHSSLPLPKQTQIPSGTNHTKGKSGWPATTTPSHQEGWRCTRRASGVLCVPACSTRQPLTQSADSWAIPALSAVECLLSEYMEDCVASMGCMKAGIILFSQDLEPIFCNHLSHNIIFTFLMVYSHGINW